MGTKNLISIVMPVYNGERFVGKAIESCLHQSDERRWELIVVDDGSTDNSLQIVENYLADTRVKLVSQENKGAAAARNNGIRSSSGNYVAFLDADDCYLPHTIKNFHAACDNVRESVALFYCNYLRIDQDGETTARITVKPPMKRPELHLQFLFPILNPILVSSTLVRKDVLDKTGMFDERFARYQGLQLFARIAERYEIAKLDFFSTGRRMHENQVTKDRRHVIFWCEEYTLEYLKRHDFCYFCNTHDRSQQAKIAEDYGDRMMKEPEPMIRTAAYLYELSLSMDPKEHVQVKLDKLQENKETSTSDYEYPSADRQVFSQHKDTSKS
ncbi:MAG: glycosyltransferase [Chlorobiales bacterium]|nr:glycosyltransferase [Chlorobiales bacterium]